jgi:ATP-dependent DNA helicase RecQ
VLAAVLDTFPVGTGGTTELYVLARNSGLDEERVRHALGLLEKAGAVELKKPFSGRAMECLQRVPFRDLGLDLSRVRAQERQALLLLKRMTDYAYGKRCRRQFILRYFGESDAARACGACDVCVGAKLKVDATPASKPAVRAQQTPFGAPENFSALAVEQLRHFRRQLAKDLELPSYLIFNDATMFSLAAALPTSREEFLRVRGAGDATWERFGPKIIEICLMARAAGHEPHVVAVAPRRRRRG